MAQQSSNRKLLIAVLLTAILTVAITALLVNIFEHKQEARNPFFRVAEITDETDDPAVWGRNFPLQYDSYKRTVDICLLYTSPSPRD